MIDLYTHTSVPTQLPTGRHIARRVDSKVWHVYSPEGVCLHIGSGAECRMKAEDYNTISLADEDTGGIVSEDDDVVVWDLFPATGGQS